MSDFYHGQARVFEVATQLQDYLNGTEIVNTPTVSVTICSYAAAIDVAGIALWNSEAESVDTLCVERLQVRLLDWLESFYELSRMSAEDNAALREKCQAAEAALEREMEES